MIHIIMACIVVYKSIHTCDFLNYWMNLKVQEWVVYIFWHDFCLNNEGTEVQHKAGVNTRNH